MGVAMTKTGEAIDPLVELAIHFVELPGLDSEYRHVGLGEHLSIALVERQRVEGRPVGQTEIEDLAFFEAQLGLELAWTHGVTGCVTS